MQRATIFLFVGLAIGVGGMRSAVAQEATKAEKPAIPGGIAGHIKSVDTEKLTLTIVTGAGTARTFAVDEETTMLGPRGGKVRRRLHDPRFHEGMELTVVASGATAREIHLGFRHRQAAAKEGPAGEKAAARPRQAPAAETKVAAARAKIAARKGELPAPAKPAASAEEDEDDEIPGTVKSYNERRRLLVVTLLNGTSRSFFLPRDLKVMVDGTASKAGVADPALKGGARVTILLAEGGRRVRELHIEPASAAGKTKKAS